MKKFVILYYVSTIYVISAVRIECGSGSYSNRPTCTVTNIDPLTKKHDEVTEVTRDKYFTLNLSSVVDIYFYSFLHVEYLPEKSCNHFNDLESFDGSIDTIKYISRGVFENCHKVKTIKISKTRLRWIPEDTFYDLPELTTLNLENNKLKYLPGNLIVQNHKLEEFSAQLNKLEIIDIQFPHTMTTVRFWMNVCVSDTFWNITTLNQVLANNCSATFSKFESLLETEKLDTDVRCTGDYFTFIKDFGVNMVNSEIGDTVREVYNWQEAEVVLDRI